MSRARIVYSDILNRTPLTNQYDEKFTSLNLPQDKILNLSLNESSNGEIFVESSNVSSTLSEMNTTVDEWIRQKTMCPPVDCIDTSYLHEANFLSTKYPDMCSSSDIGLELVLIDEKRESNLSITEKSSDVNCADPLLNLLPMNEVLLRRADNKCDNLLGSKDLCPSDTESGFKGRPVWDTLNIASRKSDCDVAENSGDFADLNWLSFAFDGSDQIESIEESLAKTDPTAPAKTFPSEESFSSTKPPPSESTSKKPLLPNTSVKKCTAVKRPNIIRTLKQKVLDTDTNPVLRSGDKNIDADLLSICENSESGSVFNCPSPVYMPENITDFIVPDLEINFSPPADIVIPHPDALPEEEARVKKKHSAPELETMVGCIAVVTNSFTNSKSRTKFVIKTKNGNEKFEGNTTELMEAIGTARKNRKPNMPVEGEHIITSVKTASSIKEEKKASICKVQQEPDDNLVREMLDVLKITDNMLYRVQTNLGLHIWICPEHECRRIFNRLNSLKSHILNHYGLKPFKCDYPECPWSFYTSFKLKRHRETHLKRKDFMCTVADCKRTFTTIYNLNTHLKLHERPARLKCLVQSCNSKFQTRRAMEKHLKTHEISSAPYKCSHPGCSKLYFSCNALTTHSRCHLHKEEELRCQWENCGKLFDKPCRLKAHMRQHTGDKPYVCKYKDCKWAFASSSKLKRHQYKHNNERKFRCTIGDCTKAFMRSEHLREHTFTHIAQRAFQCAICGEKCSAKATLYVHMKKFHPNENYKGSNKKPVHSALGEKEALSDQVIEGPDKNVIRNLTLQENYASDYDSHHKKTTYLIALLPNSTNQPQQLPPEKARPVVVEDMEGKKYQLTLSDAVPLDQVVTLSSSTGTVDEVMQNQLVKSAEKPKVTKKTKVNKKVNNVAKSCARTYLAYSDVSKKADKPTVESSSEEMTKLNSAVTDYPDETPVTNVTLSSNVLVGSDMIGNNNQETIYLSNLLLQDDAAITEVYNCDNETEYILLLNSETNSVSESTINLKDLD